MVKEIVILKAFLSDRDTYEKYAPYIIGLKSMDNNVKNTLDFIKLYYDKYKKETSILESSFKLFINNNDKFNFLKSNIKYIDTIYNTNIVNTSLTLDIIESCIEQHYAASVLNKIALIIDNKQTNVLSTIQDDINDFHNAIRNPPKSFVEYSLDLNKLIKTQITNTGLPFCNQIPNDAIGGFREGELGAIYAYVSTGKTSYGVANLCTAAQYCETNDIKRPLIYGGNEEAIKKIALRSIQCMTNWDDKEIETNEKLVIPILKQKGYYRIKFIDHIIDINTVENILTKYNPQIFFIDKGSSVKIPGSKKQGVDNLEELFDIYRDLAKRHKCTIVVMLQGGDECFEKQYPTLRDIYGSKSAIQGTLDWAISVGKNVKDEKYKLWRYFCITKLKGEGEGDTYACRFDKKRCQFKQV